MITKKNDNNMTRLLLRNAAFMAVMLVLGALDLCAALCCAKWWLSALDIAAALFAFFMAWKSYRCAREIAEAIDNQPILTLTIINHGEESESKSKGQEQAESEVQPRTDREDESEDYYSHPI